VCVDVRELVLLLNLWVGGQLVVAQHGESVGGSLKQSFRTDGDLSSYLNMNVKGSR
jgi:hypothetical protein